MQFGDQIGDMATILANTPGGRVQAMAPYDAWIGERWFVLPNPVYGTALKGSRDEVFPPAIHWAPTQGIH